MTVARGPDWAESPFCVSLPVLSMSIHNVEVPVAMFWLSVVDIASVVN